MPRRIRSLAEEENYASRTMPSIERRTLMESGMRTKTTKLELIIIAAFLVAMVAVLLYFLIPLIPPLIRHLGDWVTNHG